MEQKQIKSFFELAAKMRILNEAEKNKFLYELDKYVNSYRLNSQYHQFQDPFLPHRMACAMYYSLEGVPYTQPEFASQVSMKDVNAREKFDFLLRGIVSYREVSDAQRTAFKKSVLTKANPIKKLFHWAKTYQSERG